MYYIGLILMTIGMILISTSKEIDSKISEYNNENKEKAE
jgi:hypothetical protein